MSGQPRPVVTTAAHDDEGVCSLLTRFPSPIEVWLSKSDRGHRDIMVICTVFCDADDTTHDFDVESSSLLGAQREMTRFFIDQGYVPRGRWEVHHFSDGCFESECRREFVFKDADITFDSLLDALSPPTTYVGGPKRRCRYCQPD